MRVSNSDNLEWNLDCITVGPLDMNSWIISSVSNNCAILIDPGAEPEVLINAIKKTNCDLTSIICTHGHFDHIGAAAEIQKEWDLPLIAHIDEQPIIESMQNAQMGYGFPATATPNVEYFEGNCINVSFGNETLILQHTPGHSPGHIIVKLPDHVIVGDLIFARSVGRTDLPGGNFEVLSNSIREHIYSLHKETALHPGHGPSTSVGQEQDNNPFVR